MTIEEALNALNLNEEQKTQLTDLLNTDYLTRAEAEEQEKKAQETRENLEKELASLKEEKERLDRKMKTECISKELTAAGARNPELIMKLLGAEEKSFEESRNAIEQLKSSDPYLFDTAPQLKGFRPEPSSDGVPRPAFSDMTYSETLAYLQKD